MMRDNASSMNKAMGDANITSFGCVSHTLQHSAIKALKVQMLKMWWPIVDALQLTFLSHLWLRKNWKKSNVLKVSQNMLLLKMLAPGKLLRSM